MTDARELLERLFAIIDEQRWDDYLTVTHPDVDFFTPQGSVDQGGWLEFSKNFAAGFPDGRHQLEHVIQEGDVIAIEGTWDGTNLGPMATPQGVLPATGRRVHLDFAGIARVRDGRLTSMHAYFDQLGMLAQLGLVPEPATA
jgi:predicted ester cyclase